MTSFSMTSARSFAIELHDFLRAIDTSRWRKDMTHAVGSRCERLQKQLGDLLRRDASPGQKQALVYYRLMELSLVLKDYAPDRSLPARTARRQMLRLRKKLLPAYEGLAMGLRAEARPVPSIRPENAGRILLHMGTMVFVLGLLHIPAPSWVWIVVAGACAGICWTLETLRRKRRRMNRVLMRFFRHIAHPVEAHRVNSATWYTTALFALSWLQSPQISGMAIAVLGFGDPIAGLIGRRWGRTRLINRRTLEGSAAFVVASFVVVFLFLSLLYSSIPLSSALFLSTAAAVSGALAELLSRRVDDNFSIPLSAAGASLLAAWLIG